MPWEWLKGKFLQRRLSMGEAKGGILQRRRAMRVAKVGIL